jgi:hypothetical protein
LGDLPQYRLANWLSQELAAEMLTYYDEAVHSLDAVGVDPIHLSDLATSKVAADNNIAGPILRLARTLTPPLRPRNDGTEVSRSGAPVIERAMTSQALIAYVSCNLVAAMPKLSLNSLPRSKFSEAFCHVVRAFGIHPQFV